MKKDRDLLTQGFLQQFFTGMFKSLGIDRKIAVKVMKDPNLQKQIKEVQKTLKRVQDLAQDYADLQSNDYNY